MPAEYLYQYRIYCETEVAFVTGDFRPASEGPQTTCPHNTAHVIDPTLTTIVETVPPDGSYDADGNLLTVPEPRSGTEVYFYVPNLCDKCAWYQKATPVVGAVLTDSGDHLTYTSANTFWIDLTHGRVFGEDNIPNRNQYIPVIEVDTGGGFVAKVENSWGATDYDYTVNYETGAVTFNVALAPTDVVRASYYFGLDSEFTVEANPGTRLKVLYTEVQFTKDVEMNANIHFEIWVYNPASPPDRVLYKFEVYKRLFDFFQESTGPFPVIPAFGGAGNDRAIGSDVITIPFQYQAYRDLKSSQGTQLRIRIEGNIPMGGEYANATLYCLTANEG
jgi:hypothetical protein